MPQFVHYNKILQILKNPFLVAGGCKCLLNLPFFSFFFFFFFFELQVEAVIYFPHSMGSETVSSENGSIWVILMPAVHKHLALVVE